MIKTFEMASGGNVIDIDISVSAGHLDTWLGVHPNRSVWICDQLDSLLRMINLSTSIIK